MPDDAAVLANGWARADAGPVEPLYTYEKLLAEPLPPQLGCEPMCCELTPAKGYAPEKIEYGINRYQNETRRLYRVMDTALAASSSGYLVGDRPTIADFSCWGWVCSAGK